MSEEKRFTVYSPTGKPQKVNERMVTECWKKLESQGWTKEKPKS